MALQASVELVATWSNKLAVPLVVFASETQLEWVPIRRVFSGELLLVSRDERVRVMLYDPPAKKQDTTVSFASPSEKCERR